MESCISPVKAEKLEKRDDSADLGFIRLPLLSAAGDSGLNQLLGDDAHHISQLQGKALLHSTRLINLCWYLAAFGSKSRTFWAVLFYGLKVQLPRPMLMGCRFKQVCRAGYGGNIQVHFCVVIIKAVLPSLHKTS